MRIRKVRIMSRVIDFDDLASILGGIAKDLGGGCGGDCSCGCEGPCDCTEDDLEPQFSVKVRKISPGTFVGDSKGFMKESYGESELDDFSPRDLRDQVNWAYFS